MVYRNSESIRPNIYMIVRKHYNWNLRYYLLSKDFKMKIIVHTKFTVTINQLK